MRNLCYIANSVIPSTWANSIHPMKMCSAFSAHGLEVELVIPLLPRQLKAWLMMKLEKVDVWSYYSVNRKFAIKRLLFPNLVFWYKLPTFGFFSSLYAKFKGFNWVYSDNLWAAYWLCRLRVPVVFEANDFAENARERIFLPFLNITTRDEFLGIIAISRKIAEQYEQLGMAEDKILVARMAVDPARFEPCLGKDQARAQLALPAGRAIVCHSGNLYPGRGIDELLDCAALLKDVLFVFIGGSRSDIERYRMEARKRSLDNVTFKGYVPHREVPTYLCAADVLVMPYTTKVPTVDSMSPMKMFEYMQACRPIVATDHSPIREVLKHLRNAILVKPDSAEALVTGIREVLENHTLAKSIAEQAYKDVQSYTWDNRAKTILQFIDHRLY